MSRTAETGRADHQDLLDAIEPARMQASLTALCAPSFAGRGVGTAGHAAATAWLTGQLRGLGLEPAAQEFAIPRSFRLAGPPRLTVAEDGRDTTLEHRVEYAEHPRSASMPAAVTGRAEPWDGGPGWTGGWAVLDSVPPGAAFADLAEEIGRAGGRGVLTPQNADGSGFLTKRVVGASPVGLPVVAVRTDVLQRLAGRTVTAHVPLHRGPATGTNVVATLPGAAAAHPVLLTAHYDGVGADPERHFECAGDNASGVAVLLEVARVLTARPAPFPRPVLLAFLDAEEIGALGSKDHAEILAGAGTRADVLNLDMAGKLNGTVAAEVGPDTDALVAALDTAGRRLRIPLAGGAVASDNRSYAARGHPAVGLGLGAAHYHSPLDRVDRIDPAALRTAARLLVLTAAHLAHSTTAPSSTMVKEN